MKFHTLIDNVGQSSPGTKKAARAHSFLRSCDPRSRLSACSRSSRRGIDYGCVLHPRWSCVKGTEWKGSGTTTCVVARHFANSIEHALFTVSRLTTAFQRRRVSVSRAPHPSNRCTFSSSRGFYFMNNLSKKKLNFLYDWTLSSRIKNSRF